jgi:hypothetical protein
LCGLQSSQRNGRCGITAHRFKNNILRQLVADAIAPLPGNDALRYR